MAGPIIPNLLASILALLPLAAFGADQWEWQGHTYRLFTDPESWHTARRLAENQSFGGHPGYLVRIDSSQENQMILEKLRSLPSDMERQNSQPSDGSGAPFVWLGGSDHEIEGRWEWSNDGTDFWFGDFNGSPVNDHYTNWGVQPDSMTGDEDALAMGLFKWPEPFYDLGDSGQWNDLSVNEKLMFVVEFSSTSNLALGMNEPVQNRSYAGIGMIRGWAVSSDEIESVEVYLNGRYRYKIPYGDSRPDIGRRFPEIEDSQSAGFSMPINYSGLPSGTHHITIKITDKAGSKVEKTTRINTLRFEDGFVGSQDPIELLWAETQGVGDSIYITNAAISGDLYDIVLRWRPGTQKFEVVRIELKENR